MGKGNHQGTGNFLAGSEGTEGTEVFETPAEVVEATEVVETATQPADEFVAEGGAEEELILTGAPTPEEAAAEAKDTRIWHLADGTEVSKSEFVRDQFTNQNKSRKAIAAEFVIPYRTVYGATVNMFNEAEPSTRGRSASVTKINVTADGHVITEIKDGDVTIQHVDNVAVTDEVALALGATTEVDRNTWIKDQVAAGVERGKVASALGLSYGVVYGLTKEVEGSTQRHEMTWEGETVSRSEYIRRLYATGTMSKSDIAKQLEVDYPVVWSALKALKPEQEKFDDAIDKVSKFEGQVEDVEGFKALLELLKAIKLKEVVEAPVVEEAAAATDSETAEAEAETVTE